MMEVVRQSRLRFVIYTLLLLLSSMLLIFVTFSYFPTMGMMCLGSILIWGTVPVVSRMVQDRLKQNNVIIDPRSKKINRGANDENEIWQRIKSLEDKTNAYNSLKEELNQKLDRLFKNNKDLCEELADVKKRNAKELADVKKRNAEEIADVKKRNAKELADVKKRNAEEIADVKKRNAKEIADVKKRNADVKKRNAILQDEILKIKRRLARLENLANDLKGRHYFVFYLEKLNMKWYQIEDDKTKNAVAKFVRPANRKAHPKTDDAILNERIDES